MEPGQTRPSGVSSLFNSSFSILSSAACSGRQRGKSARLSHLRGRNSGHHTGAQVDSLDHHNYILQKAFINHRFSSKAESHMFRLWGADVVNMTTIPEVYQSSQPTSSNHLNLNHSHLGLLQVVLAKEAGLSYAAIAMPTDYDCWKEGQVVDVTAVMEVV